MPQSDRAMGLITGAKRFPRGGLLTFAVLVLVPFAVLYLNQLILLVPFDGETAARYIEPFMFQEGSRLGWALTESVPIGIFRPLYGMSFLLDYHIWGGRQFGYHLTDFLLTWGAFAMAFALFIRRFGKWTASLAVSIWILLPVQLHSMLRFYGRNDRLMIYFLLGALLVYDRALGQEPGRDRSRNLVLSGMILSLGLLTKESVFYYGFVLFAWSFMVAGRGFRASIVEDRLLWIVIAGAAAAYFILRALAGIPFGDAEPLEGAWVYFLNLGRLVAWGLPIACPVSLQWIGFGTWALAVALPFLRRLPAEIRFGGFCLLGGFLHLPLFWVQRSFLWIPWLFGSLAVAGCVMHGLQWVRRRWRRTGLVITALVSAALLGGAGYRSLQGCRSWCHAGLTIDQALIWMLENLTGPVYDGNALCVRFPEFKEIRMHGYSTQGASEKFEVWVTSLARIRAGRDDIGILWVAMEVEAPSRE